MNPLSSVLSVCVITFNRAEFLKECLESFLPNASKHGIPIFISDNASTDGTSEMVAEMQLCHSNIFYHRNLENIGPSKNLFKVLSCSNTKFCWLFSDDDIIQGDPFPPILTGLSQDAELIVVNAATYESDLAEVVEGRRLDIVENKEYSPGDHDRFLEETAFYTTFLGSLVLNRKSFMECAVRIPDDSYFPHFEGCLHYIVNRKILLVAEPFIKIRLGNSLWSENRFEVLMLQWPLSVWRLDEAYRDTAKQKVVPRNRILSPHHMLAARAMNIYGLKTYTQHIKNHLLGTPLLKQILFLIAIFPANVAKLLFRIYLRVRKPRGYKVFLRELNYQ